MSWSISAQGKRNDIRTTIANQYAPAAIKAHLIEAVEAYPVDAEVKVYAYGHLYNGQSGNYDVTSASIDVREVKAPPPVA